MEEFRCEYAQIIPTFIVLRIANEWTVFQAIFQLRNN